MIKVENIDMWGFDHAIRGMRNPMNSWGKSDSLISIGRDGKSEYVLGSNDLRLMQSLYRAGTEHRKYLRQIFVSMDIVAPLYWWKEFDTYKVGTVVNSCSTMHKIAAKEFELDDFSHEHIFIFKDAGAGKSDYTAPDTFILMIDALNHFRELYLDTKNKDYWWQMIQLLPSSYNQRRTVTMNYENVISMIKQRTGHKLDEWNEFVQVLKELPHIKELIDD